MIFGKKKKEGKQKTKKKTKKKAAAKDLKEETPRFASRAEIREHLKGGWLKVLITFELVGKPKEHIEQTLKAYLLNIKGDSRVLSINEDFADAIQLEDGLFSTFCEFEGLVQDLEVLTWLAVNFMPASIELLEPSELKLEARVLNNWYNDLMAKLHETSNVVREERAVNKHLTKSLNALIQNAIILSLKEDAKEMKELEKSIGIQKKQLQPFIDHLRKKEKIIEEKGVYSLP